MAGLIRHINGSMEQTQIIGETNATYTTSALLNGNLISVQLTSDLTPCTSGNPATSNIIPMKVNAILPVSVSISSNTGNTICQGTSVTFTATPVNEGTTPLFQWFNGVNPIVGQTNPTYTSSTLTNGDDISVLLTSSEICTTGNPASSNNLLMIIGTSGSSTTSITTCDNSYEWNGTTYTTSGTYIFTTTTSGGCDSTATLNLIFGNEFAADPITGPTDACPYVGPNALIATYAVNAPLGTSFLTGTFR